MLTFVGGLKYIAPTAESASPQWWGFGWWEHRAWGADPLLEDHPMPDPNPVHATRIAEAVKQTKRQRRLNAKARSKRMKAPKQQPRRKDAVPSRSRVKPTGTKTKQQACLDLLSRPEGATIEELQVATGWQQHSVRGFLAGAVKKKFGLTLLTEKPDARPRRYRIATTAELP